MHAPTQDRATGQDDPPLTPAQFLKIARKHSTLFLACVASVTALAAFWTLSQPKIYRSTAMLRLDPNPPKPLGQRVELVTANDGGYWNRREFYESEFRIIRSMRVAMEVVRTLGLNADPGFLGIKPGQVKSFKSWEVADAAVVLISRLGVEPIKESNLAVVTLEETDPKRCRAILSAVLKTYLAQNLDSRSALSTSAAQWLNGQLEQLKGDLEKSEVALNEFRKQNNVISLSLEDRHNMISAQLESLQKQIIESQGRRDELAARHRELSKIDSNDPTQAGATELLASSVLSGLRTSYAEQKQKLAELQATYGDENPKVVGAKNKLDEAAKAIRKEIENIKAAAAGDLRKVEATLGNLIKRDADLQRQAHDLQGFEVPFNQLTRTRVNNEKLYSLVLERARETEITRVMNFNNVQVIDEPLEAKKPARPNNIVNIAIGSIVGIVLGLLAALARELSDLSLKTPEEVESLLGISCLGLLPTMASKGAVYRRYARRVKSGVVPETLGDRDLVVWNNPDGAVAEAARAIRTNLTFMSPDHPYRTLCVTSAQPQEGKTTVGVSLATVLAQSGKRVLLVDTDLRRPRLHRTFNVSNDVGVSMEVSGQATLDECIQETPIENLFVLTSGPIPPNPAEILQSERFHQLVEKLKEKFDRIVFDSPPLLPVTDAAIISQYVDGVIMVTWCFKTERHAARHAVRQLRDVKAHIVGSVLNAVDLGRSDYREYQYYRRDAYYSTPANT